MSQATDYTVDNSTGANVRADINAIFGAVATNNSGGSDNGSVQALGFFANTSTSKLQLKNAAGNAFINLRGFDGTLPLPDGTNSSPSLFFDDDTNTGIYSSAADTFNVATGGVERMELGATTIFNEDGADVDFRIEGDTEANLFYVDAGNDRVGIGTASPTVELDVSGSLRLHSGGPTRTLHMGSHSAGIEVNVNGTTFIQGRTDNYPLAFKTQSSERMRIDGSGNVMIGTTTANALFDVNGQARFGGNKVTLDTDGSISGKISNSTTRAFLLSNTDVNADFFGGRVIQIGPTGAILIGGTAGLSPSSYSSPNIKLDPTGNSYFIGSTLSVGTSSHGAKMAVVGSMSTTNMTSDISGYLSVSNTNQTDNNHTGIIFGDRTDAADFVAGVICQISDHAQNFGTLRFVVNGSSGRDERMRINDVGNVAIGTTGANNRLEIAKAAHYVVTDSGQARNGIHIRGNGGNSGEYGGAISFGCNNTGAAAIAAVQNSSDSDVVGLAFFTHESTSGSNDAAERARFNSDGDFFIGTTTVNPGINNYQTPGTMIRAAAGDYIAVSREQGTSGFFNRDNSTGAIMSFAYNGTQRGTISTNGTVISVTGTSDYRLKENNVNISDAITRLKQLKPYRFNFKETPSKTQDGFFAHEVSTVVPEAVFGEKDAVVLEDSEDGTLKKDDPIYQQLDNSKLVPLLVAAVKELITKVETLEAA